MKHKKTQHTLHSSGGAQAEATEPLLKGRKALMRPESHRDPPCDPLRFFYVEAEYDNPLCSPKGLRGPLLLPYLAACGTWMQTLNWC